METNARDRRDRAGAIIACHVRAGDHEHGRSTAPDFRPSRSSRLAETIGRNASASILCPLCSPHAQRRGRAGPLPNTELSWPELSDFLIRFEPYFAGDARHDVWVYTPETKQTLVWSRHNQIFAEGDPLSDIESALVRLGFKEGMVGPISVPHCHHYRSEFDDDAAGVLTYFDWHRTPLRPEDEQ